MGNKSCIFKAAGNRLFNGLAGFVIRGEDFISDDSVALVLGRHSFLAPTRMVVAIEYNPQRWCCIYPHGPERYG
jgi:dTDP-glucose pyrophosphorylase